MSDRREVAYEVSVDGYDAAPMNGVTDYCMFGENGDVLAVLKPNEPGEMQGLVRNN